MFSWGRSTAGQLGLGGIEETAVLAPRYMRHLGTRAQDVAEVCCGWEHTVVVMTDGSVHACGSNDFGQLGLESGRSRLDHVSALEALVVQSVACGQSHTLAITDSGVLYTWGSNSYDELGRDTGNQEDIAKHKVPRTVRWSQKTVICQIACGSRHSVALANNCSVYAWGCNRQGQIGLEKVSRSVIQPTLVAHLAGIPVVFVAAGGAHTFALTASSGVYAWGKNSFGQLGLGDDIDRHRPEFLSPLRSRRIKYISCGEDHTAALTESGGLFTFGAGSYGQLGHDSLKNELTPRQVFELMGSEVSQVSCGRCHTLALVPASGRMYSFGLNGSGQLGIGSVSSVSSPRPVSGDWFSSSAVVNSLQMSHDNMTEQRRVISKIAAGGDQSFLITAQDQPVQPVAVGAQPVFLSRLALSKWVQEAKASGNFSKLMQYLETIFTSPACLCGSFLDSGSCYSTGEHTSGVDMAAVRETFEVLGNSNADIEEKVMVRISQLLPALNAEPCGIEALRLYLILPELWLMMKPHCLYMITVPYAKACNHVSRKAKNVLGRWWKEQPACYFKHVVTVIQTAITNMLPGKTSLVPTSLDYHRNLVSILDFMAFLFEVNESYGELVSYERFYVPELTTCVDLVDDFIGLIKSESSRLSFCRYPFVFDSAAKGRLLEIDAQIQQQSTVYETRVANQQNVYLPQNVFLIVDVRREQLCHDALTQLRLERFANKPEELRKPLKVRFANEEGVDDGGVKKEFFLLLFQDLLQVKYGMFTENEESHYLWFNPGSFVEDMGMFELIGLLCGLAIYNSVIIDFPFPLALYKKLLVKSVSEGANILPPTIVQSLSRSSFVSNSSRKPSLDDLKELNPSLAQSLSQLLETDDDVSSYGLTFQIVQHRLGETIEVDLIRGGGSVAVTNDNRKKYVDAYVDYIFNKSVTGPFEAFAKGFMAVCHGIVLNLLHPKELMSLVIGSKYYDLKELEEVTKYQPPFEPNHPVIVMFWAVLHNLPQDMKRKFLIFLTGTDRVPVAGIKALMVIIAPNFGGPTFLPVAHTCFNILDLPLYRDKETLCEKLIMAITQTRGFCLV